MKKQVNLNAIFEMIFSSKLFLMFLFLFMALDSSASENFSTHFNSNDFLMVAIPSAIVLIILLALNRAILSLKKEDEKNLDSLNNSLEFSGKLKATIVGSLTTNPLPGTKTTVLVVPKSMPMRLINIYLIRSIPAPSNLNLSSNLA